MASATYTRVIGRLAGLPAEWTEALIEDLVVSAGNIIDSFTYPDVLSVVDATAVEIRADVTLRLMKQSNMWNESGGASGAEGRQWTDFEPLTESIKERINNLLSSGSFTTIDMIAE